MCDAENDSDDDLSASDESEAEGPPSDAPFDPELDGDDDDSDRGDVVTAPSIAPTAQSPFCLKGGGSGFCSRSRSVFDCLDSVAKLTSASFGRDNVIDGVFARPLPPLQSNRKTSRPPLSSPPPAKKRGVPDYLVHPDRWTHYSLEDVAETSDQGNSRVARHFLSSLQHKKDSSEQDSESAICSQKKIIFSRPNRDKKELLPAPRSRKGMRLSLSHLEGEDEEDKETAEGTQQKDEEDSNGDKETAEEMEQQKDEEDTDTTVEPHETLEIEPKVNTSFTSFRKVHRKMYRKTSDQDS